MATRRRRRTGGGQVTGAPSSQRFSGGGGGGGGGKKGTGRPGGGTFSQFSNVNEASGRSALTKGFRGGEKVAKRYLTGGKKQIGGIKGAIKDYGKAMDTVHAGYGQGRTDITTGAGKQSGAITSNLGKSAGAVTSGAGAAKGDITSGLGKSVGATTGGYGTARGDVLSGLGASTGAVTSARDAALAGYDPYARAAAAASGLYSGAIGADPAARAAARAAFQTSPGYEFQMEQGLTGLERRAASRGQLGSGGTSLDSLTFSQGLANQDWGAWLDRLAAEQAMGVDVAGKTAGITTGAGSELANLYTGAGSALSGLDTGEAGALSSLYTGAGKDISAINTGLGKDLSGLYTGAGNALSGVYGTEASNLSNLATGEADKTAGLQTDLSGLKTDYAKTMADLAYKTKMGIGQTQAGYLLGKDKTGANIIGGITGLANTGINAFSPVKPQGQTLA